MLKYIFKILYKKYAEGKWKNNKKYQLKKFKLFKKK